MTITLTHPRINVYHDSILKYECNRFEDWMKAVETEAKGFETEELCNKFKGDMFEIFGQFFVKYFENILGIHGFEPNLDNDFGVDGSGKASREGKPAAIQFKYRKNPTNTLQYKRDLSTFFAQGFYFFKVTELENIVLISTTFETDYKIAEALNGQITHITRNHIEDMVNNKNTSFWTDLHTSIKNSYIEPVERSEKPKPWEHQIESLKIIEDFLSKLDTNRAQIIIPTGGGKTKIESEAINLSIDNGGLIHIVMAPRIALINQILYHCWEYKDRNWGKLLVRSGKDEHLKFYSDEKYSNSEAEATTQPGEIFGKLKTTLYRKEPILVFSTYHSAHQIGKCLKRIGVAADLVIGDEAHNMATEGFNELLNPDVIPSKKWLFFTATRRVGACRGIGMNNVERFGKMIYQAQPSTLIQRGIIVPPRIHIMRYKKNYEKKENDEKYEKKENDEKYEKYDIDFIKAAVNEHIKKFDPKEFRLIVACRGVPKAHSMARKLRNKGGFEDFFIATISSDQKLMRKEISKLSINSVSSARKEIFKRYTESRYAILLHFNILSEGIDLPGTTAVMPLRHLRPISVVQFIGRPLRLTSIDRKNHLAGKIRSGKPEGWEKPFGWVILPDDEDGEFRTRTKEIIYSMRRSGFDPDISYTTESDTSITKVHKNVMEDLFPELPKEFKENVIKSIEKEIKHEIEEEELALIKQDQTILEFAKWKGN